MVGCCWNCCIVAVGNAACGATIGKKAEVEQIASRGRVACGVVNISKLHQSMMERLILQQVLLRLVFIMIILVWFLHEESR